jgi:rod shape-determining protein MreD
MRRRLLDGALVAAVLVLAAMVQLAVGHDLSLLGGGPDLVCVIVVSVGLLRGEEAGAAAGFAGGFLLDALGGTPLGVQAAVYTVVGYVCGRLGGRISDRAAMRPLGLVALAGFAAPVAVSLLEFLLGSSDVPAGSVLVAALASAAIDVLVAIPLYPALRALVGQQPPTPAPPTATGSADGPRSVVV